MSHSVGTSSRSVFCLGDEMRITGQQLASIAGVPLARVDKFVPYLNGAMEHYQINTPARVAAFLAQLAHESGGFRYVRELASGRAYEGRKDLGNIYAGDGVRFKGRGLIQITGRANYQRLANDLQLVGLLQNPHWLESDKWAVWSAGWFWDKTGLNTLADEGLFKQITRKINGGYNGLEDRYKYYERAKKVLGVA